MPPRDADRRIREFNPAAERLFGRARADVLGLDMPETLVPERLRPAFVDAMVDQDSSRLDVYG